MLATVLTCAAYGVPCISDAAELSVPEIVSEVRPAVVLIQNKKDNATTYGSGFLVDPSGVVATNVHVIRGATEVRVKLANGDVYDRIRVIAFDDRRDLVLIKIAGFGLPCVNLGNSDQVVVGETVVVVGNPMGALEGSVSRGIVSAIRRTKDGSRVIQTDAAANPGNSGGPLINSKGEVIGIVSFKLKGAENLNFVVPINYARGLLDEKTSFTLKEFNEKVAASAVASPESGSKAFPKMWKIPATAGTMAVRLNAGHVYLEAVGSKAWKDAGGFRTADVKKDGNKYVGTARIGRPCRYRDDSGKNVTKVCLMSHGIEILMLTPGRIEGLEELPEKDAKFKCEDCSWSPPEFTRKAAFVLIPE